MTDEEEKICGKVIDLLQHISQADPNLLQKYCIERA